MKDGTIFEIRKEQCGFKKVKIMNQVLNQVFVVCCEVCVWKLVNGKYALWTFKDLEQVYGKIIRHAIWQTPKVYGVWAKMMKAVKNFYVCNRACIKQFCDVFVVIWCLYGLSGASGEC